MGKLKPYSKAIAGALVAGLTALLPALDGGVTAQEWVTVALATVVGLGVVYAAPRNTPPTE